MSRRIEKRKERERRVKKEKAQERQRRQSQPPPAAARDSGFFDETVSYGSYGSSFGPLGEDAEEELGEFFAGFRVPD